MRKHSGMMERHGPTTEYLREKEIPYWQILLFTLAVGFLFLLICFPTFETSDDATIIRMIDGSKGSTDPHLIYQNVLLGYFYMLLYRIPIRIAWYSVLQCAMVLISISVLAWCICRLHRGIRGITAAIVLELFLGYECLIQIQYTKTAGLAACAGVMLLLCSALRPGAGKDRHGKHDRKAVPAIAAGILLIFYGSLMRFAQAAVCVALLAGAIAYALILLVRRSERMEKTGRLLGPLVLAGLLVLAGYGIDTFSYSSGRLSGFKRFDAARIELLDHGMPEYSAYAEEMKAMGIKKSAWRLLKGWTFADPEVFTADVLEQIGALKGKTDYISRAHLKSFVRTVPAGMLRRRFFYYFLTALLIWLLMGRYRHNAWNILCAFCGIAVFTAMNYYLFCGNRYLVNRVDVPMLLSLSLAFLFLGADHPERIGSDRFADAGGGRKNAADAVLADRGRKNVADVIGAAAFVLAVAAVFLNPAVRPDLQLRGGARAQMFANYAENSRELLYQAGEDRDHLYMAKLYTISDDYAFGVFETAPKGCLSNILWLGGWSCYSGCYQDIMEKYGITNPLKDLIDHENVLLVDNKVGQTEKYLRAYYDNSIEAVQTGEIGSFPVYTVRTGAVDRT